MSMLFRYVDLLRRRPAPPSAVPGEPAGLLAAMSDGDRPRGLLDLVGESQSEPTPTASGERVSPAAHGAQAGTGATPAQALPPIPAHKNRILDQAAWAAFHHAMDGLQGLGPNARSAFARTFAEEGGMKPNPSSGAVAGIMPATFEEIRRSGRIPELANIASVGELTPQLAAILYQDIANQRLRTVGGAAALEQIDDDTSAALYDSLFQHGGAGGTRLLQESINTIIGDLPDREKRRLAIAPVATDRRMGPATFGTFRTLVTDRPEMAARLLDALSAERSKPANGQPWATGDLQRFLRFRSRPVPPSPARR